MKKSKKIIGIMTAVIALSGALSVGVHAYFTSQSSVSKTLKVLKIDTEIEEEIDLDGTKKVSVKNVGSSDCYVRVRVTTSPESILSVLTLKDFNTEDWFYVEEEQCNYYYYKHVLKVGETSKPLFAGYEIDKEALAKLELGEVKVDIIIYEESVQILEPLPSDSEIEAQKVIVNSFSVYEAVEE